MIEHISEHVSEPPRGHRLISIREVTIIPIEPQGHTRGDLRVEFRWIKSPLLARVSTKKLFVEFAPDTIDDHILGIQYRIPLLNHFG